MSLAAGPNASCAACTAVGHRKVPGVATHYGDRRTVVKDRRKDIGPGLLAAMTRQLGLEPGDLH